MRYIILNQQYLKKLQTQSIHFLKVFSLIYSIILFSVSSSSDIISDSEFQSVLIVIDFYDELESN